MKESATFDSGLVARRRRRRRLLQMLSMIDDVTRDDVMSR